jgi:lipopolysaccharide transport system ATP-binding protein
MNSDYSAITVKDINKIYRIGVKEDIQDSFSKVFFDFIRSPLKNYRKYRSLYNFSDINTDDSGSNDLPNDVIWAVKNVSFEIKQGEAVGLIGGNGAGKSTLLKILARITDPTKGYAKIRGRISSLLEVGTGFHQELTGRENVYLNGTILGMTKKEVDTKFDEIVAFSGIEKFIDTPVKRYSSGMKVRLAFAVAAFMEPEILLVDEVLAVGDAAFQTKCLGKMSEVSKQGRTVIFVSHNMSAIENLCSRVILLEHGKVKLDSNPNDAISAYLESISSQSSAKDLSAIPRESGLLPVIKKIEFINQKGESISTIKAGEELTIHIHYQHVEGIKDPYFGLLFENHLGVQIFLVQTRLQRGPLPDIDPSGIIECKIPRLPLVAGTYFITAGCGPHNQQLDHLERCGKLSVAEADVFGTGRNPNPKVSLVFVDADWEVVKGAGFVENRLANTN